MARVRTVDFLPEIFQTSTNRQFLGATLDQLVQEPKFKRIQGFVGRRVGPGVNPSENYVAESSAVRTNYQLEPGVVFLSDDRQTVEDAITYPGITDALNIQGAITNNSDRLYTSDYYTWDPFVDFDKFVNFNQYYWLPGGPDSVDVFAEDVATTDDFDVTRENGVYTFSGVAGENPVLTLVRGGNYTFNVAQNEKETVNFRVTNQGTGAYVIDYQPNPILTLVRGNTYVFNMILNRDLPMYIKTAPTLGTTNQYTNGVTNNGISEGLITFVVPQDAPDTLYYVNPTQPNMQGKINVVDATPGTGPGFWIQTDPGISGRIPSTPNISSRDVLGVVNNGEDLGTVTFNVPLSTAQNFYYTLDTIGSIPGKPAGTVDLIVSNLKFNEINNQYVIPFLEQTGGIDGTTSLNGKTIVFLNNTTDPTDGGWQFTTQFDPLANAGNVVSGTGSYDTTLFDQTTDVPGSQRYNVWQIEYVNTDDGSQYIRLVDALSVSNLQKFTVTTGTQYSSTQWYKDAEGFFQEIPLLTAVRDTLYYQDGTDPAIFGRIKLINQDQVDTLDISDILDKKNYTSPNGVVFTNGLKVQFAGSVNPSSYQNQEYYVEGVGTAIKLLPVANFVTPETYTQSATVPYDSTGYDIGNYDASLNQPLVPDYLTVNRASTDLNAWTRSNRWFHIDVINATAEYNNTIAVLDNNFRAKRPVLEFRAGTRLFNFGTQGKQPVDIIDFASTDALSTINGTTGYSTDGYTFINGSRVIFANDSDPQVRNKVYVVEFIIPDSVAPLIIQPIINLVPASDSDVLIDQTVVCLSGATQQGLSYYFDGVNWLQAQEKTTTNQAPLFDVYDLAGVSFSNREKYPSTNFLGSKLFSYSVGSGTEDNVLGFPLRYLSLANVGDIVFENNLYNDTFTYTKDSVSSTEHISQGLVREYSNRTVFTKEIGWQSAVTKSIVRQQFRFIYDGQPLSMDVAVDTNSALPALQVYVSGEFIDPTKYTYAVDTNSTTLTLSKSTVPGAVIEVDVISDQVSKVAFYEVPVNLENNPLNKNSPTFTLGTIRSHYETIGENLKNIVGPINGANNTRDLGNIGQYGTNILQQSSPMTLAGYFMRSEQYNIFNALNFNSREYEKFKAQLLDTAVRNDYTNYNIPDMLTAVISDITTGRTQLNPFYWSDMLPASSVFTQTTTTYTLISTSVFDLSTTYDFTSSNYQSVLVYVNDVLLTFGYDYTIATDGPRLTITSPLVVGDVVVIREYLTTYGSFVPNTPTKLGLYPAFKPQIYLDTTYVNPTLVIQGHDGSKTVAFGDFRDSLLLEFETRIYNNLKIKSAIPLPVADVIPGQFRTTDYTLADVNQILATDFLTWVGWNKLNYQQQDYIPSNEFTWNYSASGNKLSDATDIRGELPLPAGAWRGIYRYFYDTDYPDTRPWEMLGFSEEPAWWEDIYGATPYTSGNLVLWDDLEHGRVADPAGEYILPQYARPGLSQVIPTGDEGQLLSPFDTVVGLYDSSQFQKSWTFGDGGPVEATWFKSSSYPFAIMRLLALTRPAEFFSLFVDRDLYKFDTDLDQYLYNNRYRLDANGIEIYGNGVSKASYIDWIVDYNQLLGVDSTTQLTADLAHLDVRLCYRLGSFTDKQYLKIYTEKSSPNSLNSSLLLPDESYNLLLYKNQPFERTVYSSVIIQTVDDGYAVYGYSITNPYFEILASKTSGTKITIEAGGSSVQVSTEYSKNIVQVPYGYVFANQTVVADFLLSYGALLESQGLIFDGRENGYNLNWNQMAQEFLYWANQGWQSGSVINLNPSATTLTAYRDRAIVDSVVAQTPENLILDQNRSTLPVRDLVVDRFENIFKISSLSSQTISYLDLKYTSYESMVVLDNVSIFNDLIYDPATGARQGRINVSAAVSAEWTGQLDAQGFVLNNRVTVKDWEPNRKYAKGEIVLYKNNYWSAQTIVQPSAEFRYGDWVKSDYTKIQTGLLENIPNKANQLTNSYNTNTANLESDQDLLSYGLIGFRPREYMTALNLDDVSQVNVYQQFLNDKGTIRSVRLLGNANLGKEVAEYDVFENWAIQRATYGANANRSFFELQLNEALLESDPALIQVVEPQQISQADQTVLLDNIWRESYKLTSTDILPTTTTSVQDAALPTAGYVNLDDVDITVFSLLGELGIPATVLDTVGVGTTIWAAKSNSYDWNIYRCTGVPGRILNISSNLDTTSTITFSRPHGLNVDSIIIVRFVNDQVNGVYRVLAVPGTTEIVVELPITVLTGLSNIALQGIAYSLQTMRVAQASNVVNLPYVNSLLPGARAWVDNNGSGLWEVIEKQAPFTSSTELTPDDSVANSRYGASIAQGVNNIIALVGAPAYSTTGAVYPYLRDNDNQYIESSLLLLGATATEGYGNAVDIGNQEWCVIGASESNSQAGYAGVVYRGATTNAFEQRQILVAPFGDYSDTSEFGYSVTISQDERWMYISAPAENKVYAFGRVNLQEQSVKYTTDGITFLYNYSNSIAIDTGSEDQLNVVLNNQLLTAGVDYTISGTNVALTNTPSTGLILLISRKTAQTFTGDGSTDLFELDTYLYTVDNNDIFSFSVTIDGALQRPYIDYTFSGGDISFIIPPGVGDAIVVTSRTYFSPVETIEVAGMSVSTSTSSLTLPLTTPASKSLTVDAGLEYTVNQRIQLSYDNNNYMSGAVTSYNNNTGALVILADTVQGSGTYSTWTVRPLNRFGQSVATTTDGRQIIIGCPNDVVGSTSDAGSVYTFDRSVTRVIVSDPDTITYALPAGFQAPVSVLLNGTFLTNADQFINGEFTVVGSNVVLENNVELNVGDILEFESNIFNLIQNFSANSPFQGANFGQTVDMCPNNCSVYIGAPQDGAVLPEAGSVDRRVNQARIYGVITSTNAYQATAIVGATYNISFVPGYYKLSSNPSYDYEFVVASLTAGNTIRIQNTPVAVPASPNNTVEGMASAIVAANIPNITASSANGLLTISIVNVEAADELNRLTVLPGTLGTAFADLGFDVYAFTQTIVSPNPVPSAAFGSAVFIDSEADNLVIGAPGGNLYEPVTFDSGSTYFDDNSTPFSSTVVQSGAVYTFDYLPSSTDSITNPGQLVFGQQVYDTGVSSLDQWGTAVNYTTGRLLIGSPGSDLGDSTLSELNYGRVGVFNNVERKRAWTVIHQQQPVVDVYLLNSVYMYDKLQSSRTQFFDFIDPLQGKILGAARQNIDYISVVDPAKYNIGETNNNGNLWAENHVGEIWWDINRARFIDPNQDDIVYASRRWGQLFPESSIDIYQWVESSVPPNAYTGPGTPFDTTSYVVTSRLTPQGIFGTQYYFWVTGIDTINTKAGKTLSTTGIAQYIESPRSSGIPYVAALNSSTLAIYNGLDFIAAQDTILHIEYDREYTEDNIHTEFELIAQDRPDSFLSAGLYRKLQDSFCGVNATGARVPDSTLSPPEQYGVQFRPRQSMFLDRFSALENYLVRANSVLKNYPIVETRKFALLNSQEPEPTVASGEWNMRLANIEQLGYQNLQEVPIGYKYLIVSDSTNNGLWTIYTVLAGSIELGSPNVTQLSRVQTYDTRKYWNHIDWYQPGYNSGTIPVAEVPNYASLATLSVTVGSSVKVTANAQGKFEIYLLTDTGWNRVGLQDGTIQFRKELWDYAVGLFGFDVEVFDAQYFDAEPVTETRKVIQAINEELFIDELAIERNRLLILMFNFILSEQQAPEWLIKTSLIDVEHRIRELVPFQIYRQDNQEFVLDYLQEVKPYHVQVREFNLAYNGMDDYAGMMTDFDNPAYYNTNLLIPQYISPILLPYTQSTATGTGTPNANSDTPADAQVWTETPWNEWYNNYLLSVQDVTVVDGGTGYTIEPQVVVTGTAITPAVMTAIINTAGQVIGINIVDPGAGYSSDAVITFTGGNGQGARAVAVMGNELVRSIKTTIKYDRYQYSSTIVDWEANVNYNNGTQVRYNNKVWQANSNDSPGVQSETFDPDQWLLVNPGTLSGVDRTQGYYTPGPNEIGLDLPLLIDGLDYPGVQVFGPLFSQNTGYDVGNFDINPFDNISFGPEGRPTYDPAILDAIYESAYIDPFLGTRATDVNVDGGAYIDTYSSHAPEELVPGSEFDTLDLRVYTRPGSDWANDGHGFDSYSYGIPVTELPQTYNFSLWYDKVPFLVSGTLFNQTTGVELLAGGINFTIDWIAETFTVTSGCNVGDTLIGTAYGLGGGNQLYREKFKGTAGTSVTVPVAYSQIQEVVVWADGQAYSNATFVSGTDNTTVITFGTPFTSNDVVTVYVYGSTIIDSTTVNYSWSTPVTQYISAQTGVYTYNLTGNLEYTNPVNMIVNVNGVRARTAAGAQYVGDGSTAYELPTRLGVSQALIADNEVLVYINETPQILGVDFTVEPFNEYSPVREVIFATAPDIGDQVLIAVTTNTQCRIDSGQLVFDPTRGLVPSTGDVISVITWNDTRQQNILTKVYVGPTTTGATITEGYDDTDFDAATLSNTPGSFDYSVGITVTVNDIQLGRVIEDPYRLWVTLNSNTTGGGRRLFYGQDFTVVGEELILTSGIMNSTDVIMITEFTNSIVPDAMAFRIFQDMRGVQATYRITTSTTTALSQPLYANDDIVYVVDANTLDEPALSINIWGVLTVNGERIMYRERNTINNTVSGLLRGTAGTAVAEHPVNSVVYNLGRGNLMPKEFQDYIDSNTFVANGSTTAYTTDIVIDNRPIVSVGGSIAVYINSVLQNSSTYNVTALEPVVVVFNNSIPGSGEIVRVEVTNTFGVTTTQSFTATGSSARFPTTLDIGLVEQSASTYVLDDFEPVIITFDTPVPAGQVVYITNQRGGENEFDYSFSDGVDPTFATTINLTLPIRVFVGGIEQTNIVNYTISSLDPVIVNFVTEPVAGQEVTILVRRGVTWYAPGVDTPSNGVALQDTNTQAARFLRGL